MAPPDQRQVRAFASLAIMLLCVGCAWCCGPKWSQVAGWIACTCLMVWSTCLGFGYAGLLNLANGCYLAIGAYLITLAGASAFPSWQIAAGCLLAFAFVTLGAYAFVRRTIDTPLTFVVAALAINVLARHFLTNGPEALGGSNGVFVSFGDRFAPAMSGREFALILPVWVSIFCAGILGILAISIPKRAWTTLILVRDAPDIAASFGFEPNRWKLLALSLSGFGICMAGVGFAVLGGGANPEMCVSSAPIMAFGFVLLGGRTVPWAGMFLAAASGIAERALEPILPNSYRMIEALAVLSAIALLGRTRRNPCQ